MTKEYSDYLAHHGIKGQKWGVRRYQNEDGTLTPEGIKRYREIDAHKTLSDSLAEQAGNTKSWFSKGELARRSSEEAVKVKKLIEKSGFKKYSDLEKAYKKTEEKKAAEEKAAYLKRQASLPKDKRDLPYRFEQALKDHPDLTYTQIYREMGVDMTSPDTTDYKEAEIKWYRKHGY